MNKIQFQLFTIIIFCSFPISNDFNRKMFIYFDWKTHSKLKKNNEKLIRNIKIDEFYVDTLKLKKFPEDNGETKKNVR